MKADPAITIYVWMAWEDGEGGGGGKRVSWGKGKGESRLGGGARERVGLGRGLEDRLGSEGRQGGGGQSILFRVTSDTPSAS